MRATAGILGAIVGDALGVPVEFKDRAQIAKHPVTDMIGYGTYNQPPGTWSDDSSLLLCLLSSLCDGYDLNDIAAKFVDWYYGNLWRPHGEVFDIGISTREVINRLHDGADPKFSGNVGEMSNGNGSLMRILPMAYFLRTVDDPMERYQYIYDVSGITHAHVRSKICCFFYCEYARLLLNGQDKFEAFEQAQTLLRQTMGILKIADIERPHYNRILSSDFAKTAESDIFGSGYVLHSLEASIWCLLNSDNYSEAVLKAVNLGDDTDTTACITGGIAGLYFGMDEIPKNWLAQIARLEDILIEIMRFEKTYGRSA